MAIARYESEVAMNDNDRFVVKHPAGWAVKKAGSDRASDVFDTQYEAEKRAKEIVSQLGGGEVRIQGNDGKWRDSDTVPPAVDPFPPRDKKH
jgi:hypothetical protein